MGDEFDTVETALGHLSPGVTQATVIYAAPATILPGLFEPGDLRMEGEAGNDEFVVRAFALTDAQILLNAGAGDDLIEYNVNAPVDIDGGAGFDKVVALGSELDDAFVITRDGIFGAGLFITLQNIEESVEVDGLEGDDTFFILGTQAETVTTVIGDLGNDTFNVLGDVSETIVSADTAVRSGVVDHTVESDDPAYDGLFVAGINLTVAGGEEAAIIEESGNGTAVREDDASSIDSYLVSMPAIIPALGTFAYVTVSAAQASTAQKSIGGATVLVSSDGVNFFDAITLTFTDADWDTAQQIFVKAASDSAVECDTRVVVSHAVQSNDAEIDGLVLGVVSVFVQDDDKPGLVITESDGATAVIEGDAAGDSYSVALTRAPAAGETVTVTLDHGDQIAVSRRNAAVHRRGLGRGADRYGDSARRWRARKPAVHRDRA